MQRRADFPQVWNLARERTGNARAKFSDCCVTISRAGGVRLPGRAAAQWRRRASPTSAPMAQHGDDRRRRLHHRRVPLDPADHPLHPRPHHAATPGFCRQMMRQAGVSTPPLPRHGMLYRCTPNNVDRIACMPLQQRQAKCDGSEAPHSGCTMAAHLQRQWCGKLCF